MASALPSGYFETTHEISAAQAEHIKRVWRDAGERAKAGEGVAFVIPPGMRFVQFQQPAQMPDAFCRYCTVANLSSSVWCVACGAPLNAGR